MFPKGSLKVTERRGHKNLKELLAPSRFKRKGAETRERETLEGKGATNVANVEQIIKGEKELVELLTVWY